MSADNGIYILKTKDQYRVIHAQAIDNLWWSFLNFGSSQELVPTRIVEYFGNSRYTYNEETAQKIAFAMANRQYILEYGIQTISINKTWQQIEKEAKELASLEIESIRKRVKDNRWDYDIVQLEKILTN